MAVLRTTLGVPLAAVSDECLEEITADGHPFASPGWYRMLTQLDLGDIMGGHVDFTFAQVTANGVPVALCPLMRLRGAGAYFVYHLRNYYFEHWIEDAIRLNPTKKAHWQRVHRCTSAFRRFVEWAGGALDDCLIVTNPLSYRGHIPVAPEAPVSRAEIYQSLITELKRSCRQRRRLLWFLAVEDDRLSAALSAEGCEKSFLFYDNRINLENFETFDAYLQAFRRTTRRAFQRDIKRTRDAGIEYSFLDYFAPHAELFTQLYEQTYSRYGSSFLRQPPRFWPILQQNLGNQVEAIVARRDEEILGFSILLESRRRGEMWTYRIGRAADEVAKDIPYYFGLSFYGPIQRAIELGYRRIWLGPAGYEAKSVRGAQQVPLYSHFWTARAPHRWFLLPYLRLFGQFTRQQIAEAIERPLREMAEQTNSPRRPQDQDH